MGRRLIDKNRLSVVRLDLVKEWDFEKNGDLTPNNVSYGSHKKVWWVCPKGHPSYEAQINNRTIGNNGCPYCAGKKVCKDNSLAMLRPDLAKEWHKTKNGNLTPYDVTIGMAVDVCWQCSENLNHIWFATINKRSNGRGCPYCSGNKVCIDNSLAYMRADLLLEWDYKKNGNLTPYDVTCNSNKKVYWVCNNNSKHKWLARISKRHNGRGCPYCSGNKVCVDNCLATLNPELSKDWHPTKNKNLTPYDVTVWSNKMVWWCDKDGNEWEMKVSSRSVGQSYPDPSKNKAQFRLYKVIKSLFNSYDVEYDCRKFDWLGRQHLDIFVDGLKLAIEYDGEYHFKPVCYGGISLKRAEKKLQKVKNTDVSKNKKIKKHPNDVKYFVRFNCYDFNAHTSKDKVKEIVLDRFKKLNIPVG